MKLIEDIKANHMKNKEIHKIIKSYNSQIKLILEDIYDLINFRPYDTDEMMQLTLQLKDIQEERDMKIKEVK